jgi:hypothetical protein
MLDGPQKRIQISDRFSDIPKEKNQYLKIP